MVWTINALVELVCVYVVWGYFGLALAFTTLVGLTLAYKSTVKTLRLTQSVSKLDDASAVLCMVLSLTYTVFTLVAIAKVLSWWAIVYCTIFFFSRAVEKAIEEGR